MSIGTIIGLLAAGAATTFDIGNLSRVKTREQTTKAFNDMQKAFKEYGLGNVDFKQLIAEAYDQEYITEEQRHKFDTMAKEAESILKYYDDQSKHESLWDRFTDNLAYFTNVFDKKYGKTGREFYEFMTSYAPEFVKFKTNGEITGESIANAMLSGTPNYTVTAPNYLDLPDLPEIQDVDPVKRWTGPELAEFHEIPYDIAEYYDALKQGNEAAVDYANYQNAQANEASMFGDTENHANYLDSIRNTRADAIANGATLGAKYANELLANKEAISNYSGAQQDVASQAMSVLESPINADARTMTSTREYFDKLALNIEDVINQLYYNDTVRFGQDWLNNATRYRSGIDEYGNILNANANMYANYVQNKAAADAANARNRAQADDYAFLFDNVLMPRNNYDPNASYYDYIDLMSQNQTGLNKYDNLLNNLNNK